MGMDWTGVSSGSQVDTGRDGSMTGDGGEFEGLDMDSALEAPGSAPSEAGGSSVPDEMTANKDKGSEEKAD